MPYIGCQRCGLVTELVAPEPTTTRPCHRCVATMRPVTDREAATLRARASGRAIQALRTRPTVTDWPGDWGPIVR